LSRGVIVMRAQEGWKTREGWKMSRCAGVQGEVMIVMTVFEGVFEVRDNGKGGVGARMRGVYD
jgi:hypothetical protein